MQGFELDPPVSIALWSAGSSRRATDVEGKIGGGAQSAIHPSVDITRHPSATGIERRWRLVNQPALDPKVVADALRLNRCIGDIARTQGTLVDELQIEMERTASSLRGSPTSAK